MTLRACALDEGTSPCRQHVRSAVLPREKGEREGVRAADGNAVSMEFDRVLCIFTNTTEGFNKK